MSYRYSWIDEMFIKWVNKNNKHINQDNYDMFYNKLLELEKLYVIELSKAGGVLRQKLAKQRGTLAVNKIMEEYYKKTKNTPYFMYKIRRGIKNVNI